MGIMVFGGIMVFVCNMGVWSSPKKVEVVKETESIPLIDSIIEDIANNPSKWKVKNNQWNWHTKEMNYYSHITSYGRNTLVSDNLCIVIDYHKNLSETVSPKYSYRCVIHECKSNVKQEQLVSLQGKEGEILATTLNEMVNKPEFLHPEKHVQRVMYLLEKK